MTEFLDDPTPKTARTGAPTSLTGRPLLSIVTPSFNDREIIRPYYQAIVETMCGQTRWDWEIIYVDDGSSDGSQAVLAEISRTDPKVVYIELFRNFGQQRALFAGIERARGSAIITIDGDFQYPPVVILQLADAQADDCDIVSGIRQRRCDPWFTRFTSQLGNSLLKSILGVKVQDFGSPKLFSRALIDRVLRMKHYFSDVYPAAFSLHPNIIEIPIEHLPRPIGRSHWNLSKRIKLYIDIYIAYGDDQFSGIFNFGALIVLFGIFAMVFLFLYKLLLGHESTFVVLGAVSLSIIFSGLAISGWSLQTSYLVRIYRQNIFNRPYVVRTIISDQIGDQSRDSHPT